MIPVSRRSNTKAGVWLLGKAKRIAEGLFKREQVQSGADMGGAACSRKVLDGFLLEGKRVGRRGSATVLDMPALIVCAGRASQPGNQYSIDGPIISFSGGRDWLVEPPEVMAVASFSSPFSDASFWAWRPAGDRPEGLFYYRLGTFGGYPLRAAGCTGVDVGIYTVGQVGGYPMAYAKPGDDLAGAITVYAPTYYTRRMTLIDGAWDRTALPGTPSADQASFTVNVNESLVRAAGADGFICKRVAAPTYGASLSAGDIAFSNGQNPWFRSRPVQVFTDEEHGLTYDFVAVARCVIDQRGDEDRYAARCLWVSRFRVQSGVVFQPFSYLRDRRGMGDTKAANLNADGDGYTFNSHAEAEIVVLKDNSVVVLDFFLTTRAVPDTDDERNHQYRTVEALHFGAEGGAPTVTVLQDARRIDSSLNLDADDMFFPIGGDSDGVTAVFIVFSANMQATEPMPIFVIAGNASGISVVLRQPVAWRPVSGQLDANGVTYMGNGRFAFLVSSLLDWDGVTPGLQRGNWSCAVYDLATNTLELAGVIVSDLVFYGRSTEKNRGRIDCVFAGKEGTTLIATTGGSTFEGRNSGGGNGQTFISYDSGATWAQIAEYGSSQGAFYCGNALQPRVYERELTVADKPLDSI